jgi:hypothetical protein
VPPPVPAAARVVDAGCRDATHLVKLVGDHAGVTGVGVDPIDRHIAMARDTVATRGLVDRIDLVRATLEEADLPAGSAGSDLVP